MRWADFVAEVPRFAQVAHERLVQPGVLLVVTSRRDGTPRLSPVEPLLLDGTLWLSMMWHSHKAADLQRDSRVLLHSIVTSRDGAGGELKVRGRAIEENDPTRRSAYRDAVAVLGWQPEEPWFHLFQVDLADITYVRYTGNGDQYVVRWPPPTEFVRRATTPTSVGPAETVHDLLNGR
jgi:hypothetical protein